MDQHRRTKMSFNHDNPENKNFSKSESLVIEQFLDLYCHDCSDKTQCASCRLSDVWDYLHDMGYIQ